MQLSWYQLQEVFVVLVNEQPCCGISQKSWGIYNGCVCLQEFTLHRLRTCAVRMCLSVRGRTYIPMNDTVIQGRENGEVSDQKLDLQSETERTPPYLGMLEVWTPVFNVFCSCCCAWKSSTKISDWWTDRNRVKAEGRCSNTSRQVTNTCSSQISLSLCMIFAKVLPCLLSQIRPS